MFNMFDVTNHEGHICIFSVEEGVGREIFSVEEGVGREDEGNPARTGPGNTVQATTSATGCCRQHTMHSFCKT